MAAAVKIHQSTVSRVERAELLLDGEQTTAWLQAAKAPADVRKRVRALTRSAHTETQTWAELRAGAAQMQSVSADLNAAARRVQIFDPTVLPGLMQTADYARRIFDLADIDNRFDHVAALARRIERQAVLREPGRRFEFVISERLLHWEPEVGVLEPQLAQLVSAARLDAVEIAVLPDDFTGRLPWHNFVLRYPADGAPAYVRIELVHGEQAIDDPESVGLYQRLWDELWAASLTGDDAIALVRREAAARSA